MNKSSKIYIAGHTGLVGSSIFRILQNKGYKNLIFESRRKLDLLNQKKVEEFFDIKKPDYVFIAAAKVGGIHANNKYRANFIYENLVIQNNIINSSHTHDVKKLLFLGSACIYPKDTNQPIKEESILSGKLEPTNEPYSIAKIAGIKLCQSYFQQYGDNFLSVMPNNLYGPNDNYDLQNAHVLPTLLRKIHEAKINKKDAVELWGTGTPQREFLHVDDLADACVFVMNNISADYLSLHNISHLNIGSGEEISIINLAEKIKSIVGYKGRFEFNLDKPDGMMRKFLDCRRINELGWYSSISLEQGIRDTYNYFQKKYYQ